MAKNAQKQQRLSKRDLRRNGNVVGFAQETDWSAHSTPQEPMVRLTTFTPRKPAQGCYQQLIESCTITFGTGSAGTGKTHVATALGAIALMEKRIKRLVFSRPVVEAKGEGAGLGFLPGTAEEKIAPYLVPIREVLLQYFGASHLDNMFKNGSIMFVPFEHMRGRTFNNAWVIVDEAQNTTKDQMKLVMTRLGLHSKMVINGDTFQSDLKKSTVSGLVDAVQRFAHLKDVGHYDFLETDIVRNDLVREIILGYQRD